MGRLSQAQERQAWTEFVDGVSSLIKESKFKNIRTEFNGKWYPSKREASIASDLQALHRAGKINNLQEQVRHVLVPGDGKLRAIVYVSDFEYIDLDGTHHIIDVKGGNATKTQAYRLKKKMMQLLLGLTIEEI